MQCGLSRREAAEFLNVSTETIHSWSSGRRNPPKGIFQELADLYEKIRNLAHEKAEKIIDGDLSFIDQDFYKNWEIEDSDNCLPCSGARKAASAMALIFIFEDFLKMQIKNCKE